ncbi:MAG: DUF2442 domain-containing protein [Candidatus Omnitrophica bacterium]|nr:DUF2442 domain-containing protein [Candidatus Omnitrophota bacterium]
MFLHVTKVKYLHDYVGELTFNNGVSGEVDLELELDGEIFGALKNKKLFQSISVDNELGTIVWSNGADLAPEFLYEHLKIQV